MRSTKQAKNTTPSDTPRPRKSRNWIRSEWPLLLYPVLVAAAVVVVYVVNRPAPETSLPAGGTHAETSKAGPLRPMGTVEPSQPSGSARTEVAGNPGSPKKGVLPPKSSNTGSISDANLASTAALPVDNGTPGTAHTLNLLRQAVQAKDHGAIKKYIDELVAMGDDAAATLGAFVAGGDDPGCVWAAEALARIGTPAATQSLLDALAQIGDGTYKEQIARCVSNITNHESWPLLLDTMQATEDAAVRRAASTSLARMADTPIVDELVARYDAATTIEEAADLAHTMSSINSSAAARSLLALGRQVPSTPEDELDRSVMAAIANVGTAECVSFLLSRLESCDSGEGAYLMNTISKINQPQAQPSLLYAAVGNKEVSAEQGRTAAILALQNYPTEQTYVLLEQIAATEKNAAVASAASRTLAAIQRTAPALAANAQVRPDDQILLPATTVRK
jgi:HEAT repeat protein